MSDLALTTPCRVVRMRVHSQEPSTPDLPGRAADDELLAREHPLTIVLAGREVATLLCSPAQLEDLVVGFLISEGLVGQPSTIASIRLQTEDAQSRAEVEVNADLGLQLSTYGRRTVTSGCGAAGRTSLGLLESLRMRPVTPPTAFPATAVLQALRTLNEAGQIYAATHGTHACALADAAGRLLILAEDIGRHNAADKVLGARARTAAEKLPLLVTTGRVSSEIITKAIVHGVPIVASRSAPTSSAVTLAREYGVVLVGFGRGVRCAVFAGEQHLTEK